MAVFAKLFQRGETQVLVRKNVNDDGEPTLSVEWEKGDVFRKATATFSEESARDDAFSEIGENDAFALVSLGNSGGD